MYRQSCFYNDFDFFFLDKMLVFRTRARILVDDLPYKVFLFHVVYFMTYVTILFLTTILTC